MPDCCRALPVLNGSRHRTSSNGRRSPGIINHYQRQHPSQETHPNVKLPRRSIFRGTLYRERPRGSRSKPRRVHPLIHVAAQPFSSCDIVSKNFQLRLVLHLLRCSGWSRFVAVVSLPCPVGYAAIFVCRRLGAGRRPRDFVGYRRMRIRRLVSWLQLCIPKMRQAAP